VEWTSGDPPPHLTDKDKFVESCCDHLFTEDLEEWDNDWFLKEVMGSDYLEEP
jgi:hypothetical protein